MPAKNTLHCSTFTSVERDAPCASISLAYIFSFFGSSSNFGSSNTALISQIVPDSSPLANKDHCRLDLLKDEFPTVPARHLTSILKKEKTLFKSFGTLEEQLRTYKQVATPFSKIGKARAKRGTEQILIERGSRIPKELHAAKKRKEIVASKLNIFLLEGLLAR